MNSLKIIVLSLLLLIIYVIIYVNNQVVEINTNQANTNDCKVFYYHPEYTYLHLGNVKRNDDELWITKKQQVVSNILVKPGMKIALEQDNEKKYYVIEYNDHTNEIITKEQADYLRDNIDGLGLDGKEVVSTNYIGSIKGELKTLKPNEMFGKLNTCKEKND